MPGCVGSRRRRHGRHNRTPTYGKHVRTHPAHAFKFPATQSFKRSDTFTSAASPAGLPFPIPSIQRHLRSLYEDLKGPNDEFLSAEKLEDFIRNVQKDEPKPPFLEKYSYEKFYELWWRNYSRWKRPIKQKDLHKPLSQYFINSSHNTYIAEGDQFLGENKDVQYKKVLESGCRCVEIDVWNSVDETPQASDQEKPGSTKKHWSLSSILPWMKAQYQATDRATFRNLLPGKTEPFRPGKVPRARAISESELTEARIALLKREPRVCHAYRDVSLSQSIPFRTVCQTIREAAFTGKNDLPLIISLEVHTTGTQQDLMVEIMKKEWEGLLVDRPLPEYDPDTDQPTLGDLRGKILIKVKRGPHHGSPKLNTFQSETTLQGSEPSDCGSSANGKVATSDAKDYYKVKKQPSERNMCKIRKHHLGGKICKARHHHSEKEICRIEKQHSEKEIRKALSDLAIYTYSPGPFKCFTSEDAKKKGHIFSFGEERLKSLHRTQHRETFNHNKGFLARTFPESISSFLSTNPNYPTLFWRKGVQMVALNWQSWDTAMHLNEAMFDGENGFVLKPPGYQSDSPATCQAEVTGKKRLELCITILAGQHVPAPKVSDSSSGSITRPNVVAVNNEDFRPRVKGYLHVESPAERTSRRKVSRDQICRKTKAAKTDHPDWGDGGSRLHFPAVDHVVEELSFVRFRVEHRGRMRDQHTAWACIRLDRLQSGYRFIKLKTAEGYLSNGQLLVKIEKNMYDEPRRSTSLRTKTWNVCKRGGEEVSRLGSRCTCRRA
ncbi:1-phosphatidylinositol 4,5-bisphosphate phosphodiesterase 1 [Cytospora mali]|uniref:Phosphoinositide phospholipase C n=1 Tax=Cytospora mali TaxID=578113 RepID=A0A194VJK9_CYTMA|nr:1-phosphatidylinositol 4,5-bisphosphate phosphodiesterase 1 [Valsa mali]